MLMLDLCVLSRRMFIFSFFEMYPSMDITSVSRTDYRGADHHVVWFLPHSSTIPTDYRNLDWVGLCLVELTTPQVNDVIFIYRHTQTFVLFVL